VLIYFITVLGLTSEHDTGDRLTCAGCILLFGGFTVVERIAPAESMCFMLIAFVWGFLVQPGILNRCHLTLWLLIFGAFRNLFVVESHATAAWGFVTMADVYKFLVRQ